MAESCGHGGCGCKATVFCSNMESKVEEEEEEE
jgi:hypothetical protein